MRNKKGFFALLAAITVSISVFTAITSVMGADLQSENILSYEGKITEIEPYFDTDGKQSDDAFFVFITTGKTEAGEDNIVSFIVNGETERIGELEPAVGATLKAYYDGSRPVIMIYPPRYEAVAIEVTEAADGETQKEAGQDKPEASETPSEEPSEAPSEESAPEFSVSVNGKEVNRAYYIGDGGEVMVPVRAVCEALGYEVSWIGEERKVQIGAGISMTIGKDEYIFARMAPFELGTAPVLSEGVTYVPVSFFSDVMRLESSYKVGGQVIINSADNAESSDSAESAED